MQFPKFMLQKRPIFVKCTVVKELINFQVHIFFMKIIIATAASAVS